MTGQKIAVIRGDGIGGEVIASARAVLDAVCFRHRIALDYDEFDWSCHGSAPDIAGKGIANPVGGVWSAAMMLEHLGHTTAAAHVLAAMESTLAKPETRTADLAGTASTTQVTDALVAHWR